eukprot:1158699-Pelagomonas_calceolata.AAC.13
MSADILVSFTKSLNPEQESLCSIGFTRRAGATRVTHKSLLDLLRADPQAIPCMVLPQQGGKAASSLLQQQPLGITGLVFGREESGLSEAEVHLCTHACAIPTGRIQGSMNLSHAVAAVQSEVCRDEAFLGFLCHLPRICAAWYAHYKQPNARDGCMAAALRFLPVRHPPALILSRALMLAKMQKEIEVNGASARSPSMWPHKSNEGQASAKAGCQFCAATGPAKAGAPVRAADPF